MFDFQRRTSLFAAVVSAWLVAGAPASAQTPPVAPPPSDPALAPPGPAEIVQDKPTFYVRADVTRASRRYRDGEAIELTVASEADAYLYVLYQQADGQVVQIYPNSGTADNRIRARQAVNIPGPNDRFTWTVGAPYGEEVIKVIAAKEPLARLDDPKLRERLFPPVENKRLKALAVELQSENPVAWATDQVKLKTYAKEVVPDAPTGRRFGVFFGVSEYRHHADELAFNPKGDGANLSSPHKDVRRMVSLMQSECRLDEVRAFVNSDATRANLEYMVTQWLPSVSQPGDTVFVYFSGHGMQMKDDDGDEKDGKDELLMTHDVIGPDAIFGIKKQIDEGKIAPNSSPAAAKVAEVFNRTGPDVEKAALALIRATSVSDDLFGHWTQRLAGRQVILILDICHSGGFADNMKSFTAPKNNLAFDFVDGEFGRLKDLGQRDTALLAACLNSESAQEHGRLGHGVFTYHLAKILENSEIAVTLEKGYEACRTDMAVYFEKLNQEKVNAGGEPEDTHAPVLVNQCAKPVLLKP